MQDASAAAVAGTEPALLLQAAAALPPEVRGDSSRELQTVSDEVVAFGRFLIAVTYTDGSAPPSSCSSIVSQAVRVALQECFPAAAPSNCGFDPIGISLDPVECLQGGSSFTVGGGLMDFSGIVVFRPNQQDVRRCVVSMVSSSECAASLAEYLPGSVGATFQYFFPGTAPTSTPSSAPTTAVPTTVAPTTAAPTTAAPTTAQPSMPPPTASPSRSPAVPTSNPTSAPITVPTAFPTQPPQQVPFATASPTSAPVPALTTSAPTRTSSDTPISTPTESPVLGDGVSSGIQTGPRAPPAGSSYNDTNVAMVVGAIVGGALLVILLAGLEIRRRRNRNRHRAFGDGVAAVSGTVYDLDDSGNVEVGMAASALHAQDSLKRSNSAVESVADSKSDTGSSRGGGGFGSLLSSTAAVIGARTTVLMSGDHAPADEGDEGKTQTSGSIEDDLRSSSEEGGEQKDSLVLVASIDVENRLTTASSSNRTDEAILYSRPALEQEEEEDAAVVSSHSSDRGIASSDFDQNEAWDPEDEEDLSGYSSGDPFDMTSYTPSEDSLLSSSTRSISYRMEPLVAPGDRKRAFRTKPVTPSTQLL